MEETIRFQSDNTLEEDALFLASSILVGANRTVRDVQIPVAALLRYATLGVAIANNLMELVFATAPEEG